MAPKHDEIQHVDDGFTVAWDSTKVDEATIHQIDKVVSDQAIELSRIFGADIVLHRGDETIVMEVKKTKRPSGRGSRRRRRKAR